MDLKKDLQKKFEKPNAYGDTNMKIYRCKRCNYLYVDEEQEIPFDKVGEEWKCPKCRSSKHFFIEKEIPK